MSGIAVRKNERGAWCVYIDGEFVSDHRDHAAARITARRHLAAVSSSSSDNTTEGEQK